VSSCPTLRCYTQRWVGPFICAGKRVKEERQRRSAVTTTPAFRDESHGEPFFEERAGQRRRGAGESLPPAFSSWSGEPGGHPVSNRTSRQPIPPTETECPTPRCEPLGRARPARSPGTTRVRWQGESSDRSMRRPRVAAELRELVQEQDPVVGQCSRMSPEDVRLDPAGADEFSLACQVSTAYGSVSS
jgi:hypothetical protein